MESRLHDVAVQAVVERDEAHAVMVSHVGLDDRALLSRLEPFLRVIDRLVIPHRPERAFRCEVLEIVEHLLWSKRRGKKARVRGYDEIVCQTTFEPHARYTERAVLIIAAAILHGIGGLGNSPRYIQTRRIFDVPADDGV